MILSYNNKAGGGEKAKMNKESGYVQRGKMQVLRVPGLEIPEGIDSPGQDGIEARASYAYALYAYFQTLKGGSVEAYGGDLASKRVEAFGAYAAQKALDQKNSE